MELFETEIDEFGVEYDKTNSSLIYAGNLNVNHYVVRNGTKRIMDRAFVDLSVLEIIELPESLEIIDEQAFLNCQSLETCQLNNGLQIINSCAFSNCDSLKSIYLPTSLEKLGEGVFTGCTTINSFGIDVNNKNFTYESGIIYTKNYTTVIAAISTLISPQICLHKGVKQIFQSAFLGCKSLKSIILPECVESLGASAFENCISLQTVNFPVKLKSIGKRCFTHSTIKSVSIPENVDFIGLMAFSACYNLEAINVVTTNMHFKSIDGVLFSMDKSLLMNYPSASKQLVYIVPMSVAEISIGAFQSCLYLEKIELPDGLDEIKENTFSNCRNLMYVNIPNGLKEIGEYAFNSCSLIETIQLPDSVYLIKRSAFEACVGLRKINIPSELILIEANAFLGCNKLKVDVQLSNQRYKSFEGLLYEKCNYLFGLSEFYNEVDIPF